MHAMMKRFSYFKTRVPYMRVRDAGT